MLCISPLSIPRPNGVGNADRLEVPCGKCAACLTNRRNEWCIRLQIEHRYATSAYFITLTYDELNIPYNEVLDYETGEIRYVNTVCKKHIQDYIKRIRKQSKCRYYAVGEYGSITKRAHYHILLFNYDVGKIHYLARSWKYGHIQIGTVSDKSIMYVSKYHVNRGDEPAGSSKSFALMSRNPGIGYIYAERNYDYHDGYDRNYFPDKNGIKRRLPRYLRKKLYTDEQAIHLTNHSKAVDMTPDQWLDQKLEVIRTFKEKSKINQL